MIVPKDGTAYVLNEVDYAEEIKRFGYSVLSGKATKKEKWFHGQVKHSEASPTLPHLRLPSRWLLKDMRFFELAQPAPHADMSESARKRLPPRIIPVDELRTFLRVSYPGEL
jgi:hypothetical protein